MEQMNEAINNETALVGTTSQKESAYALKKVASATSEKMLLKAQAQARDDAATSTSINKEDERTDECWCGWIPENSGDDYDWYNVTRQIKADPLLAKVANDGILPLHSLSGAGAPLHTIKMLLEIYPEAAKARCSKGYLPIFYHLALTKSPSEEIVSALLEAYPGAAAVAAPNNQLPIHLACQATGVSEKIFVMLLLAHPKGAYSKDNDGKLPVDYANANKDAAAKNAALSALRWSIAADWRNLITPSDPKESQKRNDVKAVQKAHTQEEIDAFGACCGVPSIAEGPKVALKPGREMEIKRDDVEAVQKAHTEEELVVSGACCGVPWRIKSVPSTCADSLFGDEGLEMPLSHEETDAEVPVARSRSNASAKSSVSKKLSRSVEEAVEKVPVDRSRSNASAMSSLSESLSRSVEEADAEVPVARSHSNASAKSSLFKESSRSVEEAVAEVVVHRSRSNASIKSISSTLAATLFGNEGLERTITHEEADAEVPVARSRSNVSVMSSLSKTSSKSVEDVVAEVQVARTVNSQPDLEQPQSTHKTQSKTVSNVDIATIPFGHYKEEASQSMGLGWKKGATIVSICVLVGLFIALWMVVTMM